MSHGIRLGSVRSEDNTADIGAKSLAQLRLVGLSKKIGLEKYENQIVMLELVGQASVALATASPQRAVEDDEGTSWTLWVFLASLGLNCMMIGTSCFCKKRNPAQPRAARREIATQTVGTLREAPDAFVSAQGRHWHKQRDCRGLAPATSTIRCLEPCAHCAKFEYV